MAGGGAGGLSRGPAGCGEPAVDVTPVRYRLRPAENAPHRVEVGVIWRKSTYSSDQGGNCVEVRHAPEYVGVRDTKNRPQGHLAVTPETWRVFVRAVAADETVA